jgi:hypothetical protein
LRCRFFWVIARVLKKVWTYPLWDAQSKGSFKKKKTRSFFEALREQFFSPFPSHKKGAIGPSHHVEY